jgi:hypothetical protein
MAITDVLKPGDCLLYKPDGLFGALISIKTWHKISHVEVYAGYGRSAASRDGEGVGFYEVRTDGLAHILRPTRSLDIACGLRYTRRSSNTPYGWLDLLNFIGMNVDTKGIVCSAFATEFYRNCGWNVFPTDRANDVAPFEFLNLVGNGFDEIPIGA